MPLMRMIGFVVWRENKNALTKESRRISSATKGILFRTAAAISSEREGLWRVMSTYSSSESAKRNG